uniref:Cytochrome b561 domain-containing protein n=1 Tax=Araucaria cunninghamii TaxID=56994 RepID=A0A0D6R5P7_ARACU
MKIIAALICVFVVALDIAAGILGVHAEIEQNKERHVRFFLFECREPSHEAFELGVAAASLLLIAHAIANVAGGCICFGSRQELESSPVNKQVAGISLLLAWIILGVAFTLLILGAMYNNHSRDSCSLSRHKFLWFGGVLCFVHGALIAAYYVTATAVMGEDKPMRGLSMAERG